jgi:hypothetical protein
MWWLPQTSSYSYPRVTAIRIDVHPTGENPTNMTCTLHTPIHVCPAYPSCRWSPYVATFHTVVNRFEQIHCPREEGLSTQSIARRLTDPWVCTLLLSHNSQWSSGEKSSFCWQLTTRLTGPYHRHAIGTFNTCSWGPTHRSLTDIGGGYSLGGTGLPQITPQPFQPAVSTFHLGAPPSLRLSIKTYHLN